MSAEHPLSVSEALSYIRSDTCWVGNESEIVMAAATLMNCCENDERITIEDMLALLDYRGAVGEFGARCLFVRTGRNQVGWSTAFGPEGFIVEKSNWLEWLRTNDAETTR